MQYTELFPNKRWKQGGGGGEKGKESLPELDLSK